MKCDAGIHEETYTYVVLSSETTMFQGIGKRIPNELAKVLGMGWRSEPIFFLRGKSLHRNTTWTFSCYSFLMRVVVLRALAPRASMIFVHGEPAGRLTIVGAAL